MIALGTATDVKVEKLIKKTQKYIRSKGPKNYSSYAGKQYKKNPRMTKKKLKKKWLTLLDGEIGYPMVLSL